MGDRFTPVLRTLEIEFTDRREIHKHYLSETPHGGMMVAASESVQIGEVLLLKVRCAEDASVETIRGVVLWRRKHAGKGVIIGVGFFASEVEKRERLLFAQEVTPAPKERKNTRYQTTLKVTYETATDFVVDYTRNISTGGLFVKSRQAPQVGDEILFRLYPPGQDSPIDLPGEVTWLRPGGGFGIRFTQASLAARSELEKLVRTVAIGAPAAFSAPVFEEVTPV